MSTDGPDAVATETDAVSTATAVTTATTAPVTTGPHTTESNVENRTTADLVFSNDGPDFAPSVVVTSGGRSTRVALQTGRFFHFAVRRDGTTTRVAVWNASEAWDGQWDVRFGNGTESTDWRVRLHGRAFLDGIAIGTAEAGESETETPAPEDGTDEDGLLGPENGPDFDDRNTDPDAERDTAGQIIVGFLMSIGGAVVYWYARALTRFSEQIDAIGSTTDPAEVEPAGWNVFLTKAFAAFFVLFGLFWAGAPILLS